MISYVVDGVLLIALVLTSCLVAVMYRELRRQGDHRREYAEALAQASAALAGIDRAVQDIHSTGSEVLTALGTRVSEAQDLLLQLRSAQAAAPPKLAAASDDAEILNRLASPAKPSRTAH
jgi:hypothetical protein